MCGQAKAHFCQRDRDLALFVLTGFSMRSAMRHCRLLLLLLPAAAVGVRLPLGRRAVLCGAGFSCSALFAPAAFSRVPGSSDLGEAIQQIRDAASELKRLQRDWSSYAVVDDEGRAGNIDAARRILGGVAPQRGDAAIAVAQATPLYRLDGAFAAVRKNALAADDDGSWGASLDLEEYAEITERIVASLKKTDDNFYSVVYASKGGSQLRKLYGEAKDEVDRTVVDLEGVLTLLQRARVPGA